MGHLAASFEDHSLVDAQAWREDVAPEDGWVMNFHTVFGANTSVDFPADDDSAGFNLTMDPGPFTDNKGVRSINFATKRPADADGSLKAELSFKLTAVIDHACYGSMGRGDT